MRLSITGWLVVAVLALFAALAFSMYRGANLRYKANRLESNQEALMEGVRQYKVRDSLSAASVRVLEVERDELRRSFADMAALAEDAQIKLRRVESLAQASVNLEHQFTTPARDTLFVRDSVLVSAIALYHRTPHIELLGMIEQGEFAGTIRTFDTLTQIVHRVPRKFLFIRYGTKELRQEVISSNPDATIEYARYLKVKR